MSELAPIADLHTIYMFLGRAWNRITRKIIVRAVEERFDQQRADARANGGDRPKKKRKRYHKKTDPSQKVQEVDLIAGYATVTRAQRDAQRVTAPIFVKQVGGTAGVGSTLTCEAADVTGFEPSLLLGQKRLLVCFEIAEGADGKTKASALRLPTAEEQQQLEMLLKHNPELKSHNSKARAKKKTAVKAKKKMDRIATKQQARATATATSEGAAAMVEQTKPKAADEKADKKAKKKKKEEKTRAPKSDLQEQLRKEKEKQQKLQASLHSLLGV